jgi:putative copper resistance protein D
MDSYTNALVALSILLKGGLDLAYAILVGTLLVNSALDDTDRAQQFSRVVVRRVAEIAAVFLLLGEILLLYLQTALMTGLGLGEVPEQLVLVLSETHFGLAWTIGFAATAGFGCALVAARVQGVRRGRQGLQSGSVGWVTASLCAGVLAWAKAATSHAADGGDLSLNEWVHWVHLCATAAWTGLVIVSALCVLPTFRQHARLQARQAYLRGLSNSASAALLLVLASGAFNAWRGLGARTDALWGGLTQTTWGHILEFKLVLIVLAIACGALNRFVYLPRLNREDAAVTLPWEREDRYAALYQRVSRIISIEALLMVAVLVCAAWLSQSAPVG